MPRVLTASEVNSYITCRLKHHYAYVRRITRKVTMPPLRFGRAIHAGIAAYHQGSPDLLTATAAFEASMTHDHALATDARDEFERDLWTDEREDEYQTQLVLGQAMLTTYVEWEVQNRMTVRWTEQRLGPIKVLDRPRVLVAGRIDALVTTPEGRTWVREIKTAAQITSTFLDNLRRDYQPTLYLWALRLMGVPADGVEYIILRKQAPSPRVKNPLLVRELVTRSEHDLLRFEQHMKSIAQEMRIGRLYHTPGLHCGWCEYSPICPDGEDAMIAGLFRDKRAVHEELMED